MEEAGVENGRVEGHAAPNDGDAAGRKTARPATPRGLVALALLERWRGSDHGVIYLCGSEREAEHLAAVVYALDAAADPMVLPRWDCPPHDPLSPSRVVMGRRMSVLRRLAEKPARPLVLAAPDAVLQRTPPAAVARGATMRLRVGEPIDPQAVAAFLRETGYELDAHVDEPGEAALHGRTIDLFPAGALGPVRIEHDEGVVTAITPYEPTTQRGAGALDAIVIDAASEIVLSADEPRAPGVEHRLVAHYGAGDTLFDLAPDALLTMDGEALRRADDWLGQIDDSRPANGRDGLYLSRDAWRDLLAARPPADLAVAAHEPTPRFVLERRPEQALRAFVRARRDAGARVALAAASGRDRRALARASGARDVAEARAWSDVLAAEAGALLLMDLDLEAGFMLAPDVVVVAAADVLGSRARHDAPMARRGEAEGDEAELAVGDVVVDADHGLAVLTALETVEAPEVAPRDMARLTFADDATLLVPVEEIDRIWRYGAAACDVTLDRLGGAAWDKRRAQIHVEMAQTAQALVALSEERARLKAPRVQPPQDAYERLAGRFPFFLTPDQAGAVEDILADLASGRPMDRLVIGDVGFGKTEIALRAAAAVALAGRQVCVVAPTTVLARQHLETFRRRFAGLDVEVADLSRLADRAEARDVKKGLADGRIRIVVGAHGLASESVRFKNLGLLVIDEEQRFGVEDKQRLRDHAALRDGVCAHVLTMTATPIPRTHDAAAAGLHTLSVLRTPPARRLPARTKVAAFDGALAVRALREEKARGGQSFLVCPRIADMPALQALLHETADDLVVHAIHGKLDPDEMDATMLAFARGEGDVLLATNIIESGLDLPRANTIVVTGADRFGLAQLHQLRGRVGRGRRRGVALFLTRPEAEVSAVARRRLETLQSLQGLGAGAAISAQDRDARGAGDASGERQAGHVSLVGPALRRRLLQAALGRLRGEPDEAPAPAFTFESPALIPQDYAPDPDLRLGLYARLARLRDPDALDAFADEIAERFGAPPAPVVEWLDRARLSLRCRALGVRAVKAGPAAVALDLAPGADRAPFAAHEKLRLKDDRVIADVKGCASASDVLALLEGL